ncbi:tetratricopeptide repeat protein [Aquincola sp. S2]|uniref:Tetratricopeptide repeat protein n=1 Tax=Pseudaquabacterium terrae TaxID=2732868 RepID=A0ABX2ED39_9BURK|nr:tetratricopeptide repeat protein [Aquabacterium terrae]NRF65845.1 tetratricopeptide repeat protein [Aquabacterium terrae]
MGTPVQLVLLGSPLLQQAGVSHALPFERSSQLVALLALRRTWVPRAELAALLWPEQDGKLAHTNLRKVVFRLHALPWGSALEAQGSALRLVAETDVLAFEAALREQRLPEALALYRGELLASFDAGGSEGWMRWLGFERERLRMAWRGAALASLAAEGDAAPAIALSTRLLEADPLDEAALRAQMAWLARAGQAAAARQAYRRFVDRLADELGLAPGAELAAVHETLPVPGRVAAAAAPAADDGFIGRSVELRRIAALLERGECRLLCLIGPGGVGKTRLARRVLDEQLTRHEHGAVFVALEDVESAAQLAGRIAQALGLARSHGRDPLEPVIAALRERDLLLVLDNFEQLVEHAPALDRLLQACPRLKILVTSRTRLMVASEWTLPLEGLPFPDPEDSDRADAFDAVRLFVGAARRVAPALDASAEAPAIVEICRRVEGLPLALELAAAWARVLSCAAIAAELREGLELLRAVDAAHPARHASIEQVFEQSWRRLAPVERDALARLSVFRGGFAAEAARAVAGASLPVLGALADKSLLRRDGERLQLHPLVQQLAAARLAGTADAERTRAAHAAWFHRWLARLAPAVEDGERSALQAVDLEFENCREAWLFAIEQRQADALTTSVPILLNHCDYRGRCEEGLGLVQAAVDSPLAQADSRLQALLLSKASHLAYRLDRYAEAQAMATRALALVRPARERPVRIQAYNVLASCSLRLGRLADARRFYKQALALAPPHARAHNTAATLDNLALVEKRLGHYDEALRLSHESLAQHRRIGDSAGVALCLNNLGALYLVLQDGAAAAAHLREGLAICERDGLPGTLGFLLANLTEVALRARDDAAAQGHATRGIEVVTTTGNRAIHCWLQLLMARVAARRGETAAARRLLTDGVRLAIELGVPTLNTIALTSFAEVLEGQGDDGAARSVLVFARDDPSTAAADRDQLRGELARRAAAPGPEPPWPAIGLAELLQRIVAEGADGYAGLLAALRPTTLECCTATHTAR